MFSVLPPPPRYPTGPYNGAPGGGTLIETSNILSRPTGPEHQLVAGEGTYVLRYDLHLATPPPHPSEAPVHNPNPLATAPSPPTAGTRLSGITISNRYNQGPRLYRFDTLSSFRSIPPSIKENLKEDVSATSEGGSRRSNGFSDYAPHAPAFGEGNPALAAPSAKEHKDPQKKRKPKNNIIKSNSAFVSRVIPHEAMSKRLQEHEPDGLFIFANINRAFQWLDLSSPTREEQLTKVLFTKAHCLSHDVNQMTKTSNHLDVIMGFSTGDIIWYEPNSQKYSRINKNGIINSSAVSDVKWLPNSESLFLAAHMDGTLAVYDKEKEDAAVAAEEAVDGVNVTNGSDPKTTLRIKKSVQSKNQKSNPVACWKVSNQKINNLALSPDGRHLAVVCEDGALRVVDFLKESLLDVYQSYYGGLTCTCWSPDGKYIVTGGQDDLVSIWSLEDRMLVARCQGHNSWVTAVAFDPWRCDGRNYRFGSVGEDSRLLLWDFNVGMLHRPKASSVRQRGSISSHALRNRSESVVTRLRSNSNLSNHSTDGEETIHAVEPRAATAFLPPVLAKSIDEHPLCWLGFEEDTIITSCKEGHIKVWDRPKEGAAGSEAIMPSTAGSS